MHFYACTHITRPVMAPVDAKNSALLHFHLHGGVARGMVLHGRQMPSSCFAYPLPGSRARFLLTSRLHARGTPTMTSVVTVLACVAIPVLCGYRNKNRATGPRSRPPLADTAQDVHIRRRVQHAASGMGVCLGYKWAITDAPTGEEEAMLPKSMYVFSCVGKGRSV